MYLNDFKLFESADHMVQACIDVGKKMQLAALVLPNHATRPFTTDLTSQELKALSDERKFAHPPAGFWMLAARTFEICIHMFKMVGDDKKTLPVTLQLLSWAADSCS